MIMFIFLFANRKGSVIADFIMVFNKVIPTNPILLKFTFTDALNSNNEINGLQINSTSVHGEYGHSKYVCEITM